MPDRPETQVNPLQPDTSASHAMLREVQQPHNKSYLQTGVDAVVDVTFGSNSSFGKEVSRYAPTVLQTAALFTPGRSAMAASILLGASNEMRVGDSLEMQIAEFGLGATKGAATKMLFNRLGNANIMNGSLMSVPAKGVFLGASVRAIDIGLTPRTWLDAGSGGFDFGIGLAKTVTGSLDPTSLALDATIFGLAHGATSGLNKLTGGVIDQSPALRNIVMGTTFGTTSGTTQELMRQRSMGGQLDWGEIAKRGLIQGTLDGVASAPGAFMGARAQRAANERANETRANETRANETSGLEQTPRIETPGERYARVQAEAPLIENNKAVNLQLNETTPRVRLVESSGTVSGKGTVEVSGNSNVEIAVPKGETLRVVIQAGSPQVRVAEGSKGTIEVVNHTRNDISSGLMDATGKPLESVRVLSPLSEIFSPAEIERIRLVQDQQRALPKSKLFEDAYADIEALPPGERPAAIERRDVAAAKISSLVDQIYGNGASEKAKIIDIITGPPGAGKSGIVEELRKNGAFLLDSDHIKPLMDGYEKGLGTNAIHVDSAGVGKLVLERALANGDHIIYPQLGRSEVLLEKLILQAQAQGYKVRLHVVDLPPDLAARRVFDRSEQPPDERGIRQMVDPEFALFEAARNPLRVFEDFIKRPGMVNEYSHYDTNVPIDVKARLVKASHTPPWIPPTPGTPQAPAPTQTNPPWMPPR